MDQFTEELVKTGIMVAGAGLQTRQVSAHVRWIERSPTAVRRDLRTVAGFMIWEVKDMDEAVAGEAHRRQARAG